MPLTPREMVKLLEENGFVELRQRGTSHKIMQNPQTGARTIVPMHSKDLKKGTEQAILKQAGIKK